MSNLALVYFFDRSPTIPGKGKSLKKQRLLLLLRKGKNKEFQQRTKEDRAASGVKSCPELKSQKETPGESPNRPPPPAEKESKAQSLPRAHTKGVMQPHTIL